MTLRFLIPFALLLLAGCPDNGGEAYAKAEAQYRGLVGNGVAIRDPRYDEVVSLLAKVPAKSPFAPKAEKLLNAIEQARATRPPVPLASVSHGGDGGMETLRERCVELARRLGEAPAEEKDEWQRRLTSCRKALGEIEEALHHQAQPGDEGP